MPSSLAAALAASSAAKSSDRNKNELPSSPSYSRPSSLMQFKKKYEVVENNKSAEDQITTLEIARGKKGPIGTINNTISKHDNAGKNLDQDGTSKNSIHLQRENNTFTKKSYKRTGYIDTKVATTSTSTTSDSSTFNETGGVVFICDIPRGNDDEHDVDNLLDVDDCGELDTTREKTKKKGGHRKKKGRSKVNHSDSVTIASPCSSKVVFLCSIPSDESDDSDSQRIDHRHHRNNRLEEGTRHRDRENTGRRKDVVVRNIDHNTDEDKVTPRSGDTTNAVYSPQGDGNRCSASPNSPASTGPGPMPTPWSTRAQSMSNKRVDNLTTNHQSRHSNRPASHSIRRSTGFCSTKEWKSPVRHNVSNPTPSSSVVPACNQDNSVSTDCREAAASPIKLEPAALKGRWADEDSNSE